MGVPGASGNGPANDAIDLDDDNDKNNDEYDDDALDDNADDDDDDLEGADAPPDKEESAVSRKNHLLRSMVCTNDDYGLVAFDLL